MSVADWETRHEARMQHTKVAIDTAMARGNGDQVLRHAPSAGCDVEHASSARIRAQREAGR